MLISFSFNLDLKEFSTAVLLKRGTIYNSKAIEFSNIFMFIEQFLNTKCVSFMPKSFEVDFRNNIGNIFQYN